MTPKEIAMKIIDMQEGKSWMDDFKWYLNKIIDYIKLAINLKKLP